MIKYFIVAFVTAFAVALPGASFAGPLIWNSGFEASPANDDLFSQGPLRIRDLKENIRERLSVEHHFGSATTNDNGLHQVGSARCFVQDAEPTELGTGSNELAFDNTGGSAHEEELGNDIPNIATATNPAELVGHGRCWIDRDGPDNVDGTSDDHSLFIYDDDPAGSGTHSTNESWIRVSAGRTRFGPNLIPCNSFDCGVSGDNFPTMGKWSKKGASTLSYVAALGTEGPTSSKALQIVSTTDETGVDFSPSGGLKTATLYYITARVKESTGGGTGACGIATTGFTGTGAINLTPPGIATSAAAATFENLSGFVKTGTSLSGNEIIHVGIVDRSGGTITCQYNNVGMYEVYESADGIYKDIVIGDPGSMAAVGYTASHNIAIVDQDGTPDCTDGGDGIANCAWAQTTAIATVTMTLPHNGYYVKSIANTCIAVKTDDPSALTETIVGTRLGITRPSGGTEFYSQPTWYATTLSKAELLVLPLTYIDLAPEAGLYTVKLYVTGEFEGSSTAEVNPTWSDVPWGSNQNANQHTAVCSSGNGGTTLFVEAIRTH